MSDDAAIVFVVDDDVSVRESLHALIRAAGWQAETFASDRSSSPDHNLSVRAASCST
jgi:FixJ family two-component response regulator